MLAALAHQLVQDVGDDQESYQQAFGTRSICLPAVTCRLGLPSLTNGRCVCAACVQPMAITMCVPCHVVDLDRLVI